MQFLWISLEEFSLLHCIILHSSPIGMLAITLVSLSRLDGHLLHMLLLDIDILAVGSVLVRCCIFPRKSPTPCLIFLCTMVSYLVLLIENLIYYSTLCLVYLLGMIFVSSSNIVSLIVQHGMPRVLLVSAVAVRICNGNLFLPSFEILPRNST